MTQQELKDEIETYQRSGIPMVAPGELTLHPSWARWENDQGEKGAICRMLIATEVLMAKSVVENRRLKAALEKIANPRRGTLEERWDVEEIGNFARAFLDKTDETVTQQNAAPRPLRGG